MLKSQLSGFSDMALTILKERYFHEGEDIPMMFRRVAKYVANGDKKLEDKYFEVMINRDFLPNSPTLMNAGREGKSAQLSACYVLPIEDSMDGIFTSLKNQALIHKYGGGTGFNFSTLRPKGATVQTTKGLASGPVSFMELFDAATEKVMQGGMRRGANMGILDVDHPDILEFIQAKVGDDSKLRNFNISVGMTDEFMQKVIDGKLNEHEEEVWASIIYCAWKSGDPGLVFLDRHEEDNPNKDLGKITATNPCGEAGMLPYEACNLGSINLSNFVRESLVPTKYFHNRYIDYDALREVTKTAMYFLNGVIDVNHYPIPEVTEAVKKTRKIGLGVMGYADMLYMLGVRYGSEEALNLASAVMSTIYTTAEPIARAYGNSTITCIAPTGTISIIANCSSGIEPVFSLEYDRVAFDRELDRDGTPKRTILHFIHPEYDEASMNDDIRIHNGTFVRAHEVTPEEHIKTQAIFQRFTDMAVSKTINMPSHATPQHIEEAYILAWQSDCKGITVYRDGCKSAQVLYETKEKCPECGSEKIVRESGCKKCLSCGWSPCSV